MITQIDRVIYHLNKVDKRIILFILFCISSLGIMLTGNEEQYLTYTKKAFEPSWMSQTNTFTDFPGTRLLFQSLFSWLFAFFDFEAVAFIGRLLIIILIIFPFNKILNYYNISTFATLIIFLVWLPIQSLFAGEWMIGGFETKVFAYIFCLWAYYFFLRERYWLSIIFQIVAFHFHMLAAGWLILVFGILFLTKLQLKAIKYYVLFGIAVLPFIIYILNGLISDTFQSPDVNLDWVYVYYRNPHHIGIFKTKELFFRNFFAGILISSILFIYHIIVYKRTKNLNIKNLALFSIILFCQQIIMLTVAWFDKNGTLLKAYPFRTNMVYYFFTLIETAALIIYYKQSILEFFKQKNSKLQFLPYLILIIILTSVSIRYIKKEWGSMFKTYLPEFISAVEYARTTPDDSKYMVLCNQYNVAFSRMAERPVYVIGKLIPTNKELMYNWYHAMLNQEEVAKDINYLEQLAEKEDLDFLITNNEFNVPFLEKVYSNELYNIYKIRKAVN